jgi:hypothetical protein
MISESQLREKLRKIEALFAGAGTAEERLAAEAALQRVRAGVEELARHDPPIEQPFSLPDQWAPVSGALPPVRTATVSLSPTAPQHSDDPCVTGLRPSGAVARVHRTGEALR